MLKVIVIGSGIAGFSAASTIRRLDEFAEITMISKDRNPLYSPCALPEYIAGRIARKRLFLKRGGDYQKLKINTLFGQEVRELDPVNKKVYLENGNRILFDKLVLAVGSTAVVFDEHKRGVFKLKALEDADAILKHKGKRVVIVGSGAVAIEAAVALHKRGYSVTMIARFDHIFRMGLDEKPADMVKKILEERDIQVVCGETVKEVIGERDVQGVLTDKREYECDTVLYAIGVRPRTDLARQADIEVGITGGISVDSGLQTTKPGIYACGDCVEFKDIVTGETTLNLFWGNANRQGRMAAHNMVGFPTSYYGSNRIVSLSVFGNHVAGFGYTKASLSRLKQKCSSSGKFGDLTIIESEKDRSYFRLLVSEDRCVGAQFINVGEAIGLVWSIMHRKMRIPSLVDALESEKRILHRPWLNRIRPLMKAKG